MTTPKVQVRRATIEDLPKLAPLWQLEKLPVAELEGRFKEFQVVEGDGGELVGAIGLQIVGGEGRIHSETFAQFDQADSLRPVLLERIKTMAANHGLVRLWAQFTTPFWRSALQDPPTEILAKLPPAFSALPQSWLYLQLRQETGGSLSLDQEFALFKESEKENLRKIQRQTKMARALAVVVVFVVLILLAVWAFLFFKAQQHRTGAQ